MKAMGELVKQLRSLFGTGKRRPRNRESFEQLFHGFREVLDRNNRSLEVITEMGDTLGGDYLFDIQYIKRSSAELYAAVDDSIRSFDRLTQNGYPRLHEVFSKIDGQIRHVIDETAPVSEALVAFYGNMNGDTARAIGGKNGNLAEIKNALKLNVPDAFAVTTRAFDAFMRHNRIFERIPLPEDGSPASEASLRDLQELVLQGAMPPELSRAMEKAVKKIKSRCRGTCALAVRSSAGEEDGDFSFAGQFETVLNVPLETTTVEKAYRKVIASLFSKKASAYQTRLGYDIRNMKMAVGCVVMVDATTSGVLYSADTQGDQDSMIISAAWGLGASIVEGRTDADFYRVKKSVGNKIVETRVGAKDSMVIPFGQAGVLAVATPEEKKSRPSLSPGQVAELARLALQIEKHFKRPQDIEWAIDQGGSIFILQSRPLRIPEESGHRIDTVSTTPDARIIAKNRGLAVQKGAAAGPVFIVKNERELEEAPRGAVLVARHDSSHFIRVMTNVSAIITDTGTLTSHMAALCREFRIPTVVNAGNATQMLTPGQEITVVVESEGATLYQGLVRQLVARAEHDSLRMEDLFEFRKKRYLLRYIAPLNLVDPLRDDFTPEACRTMHDVLRFIHEKSVAELIEAAGHGLKSGRTVKLDLPIPAGIMLIDIGGGLANPDGRDHVGPEQVMSVPFKALTAGMAYPGVWRSDAVSLTVNDFMTSMLRAPDITTDSASHVGSNVAVISREYLNVSLKFGYHFAIVDCYCSPKSRNNHLYFRFAGGATDISKRSRRLQVIAAILGESGFAIKTKGDLIIARLANVRCDEMEKILDQLGRLISYARQLDAALHDDGAVELHVQHFLEGKYKFKVSA